MTRTYIRCGAMLFSLQATQHMSRTTSSSFSLFSLRCFVIATQNRLKKAMIPRCVNAYSSFFPLLYVLLWAMNNKAFIHFFFKLGFLNWCQILC